MGSQWILLPDVESGLQLHLSDRRGRSLLPGRLPRGWCTNQRFLHLGAAARLATGWGAWSQNCAGARLSPALLGLRGAGKKFSALLGSGHNCTHRADLGTSVLLFLRLPACLRHEGVVGVGSLASSRIAAAPAVGRTSTGCSGERDRWCSASAVDASRSEVAVVDLVPNVPRLVQRRRAFRR